MKNRKSTKDVIVSDDASRYLESLSQKKKRPKFGMNGLPKTGKSFSAEERDVAFNIFCPKKNEISKDKQRMKSS